MERYAKLIILLGVLGTSASAIFTRISTAPSMVLAMYRMCIASALLLPGVLTRARHDWKELDRRTILLCTLSGMFLALHFTTYFESIHRTSVAAATILGNTQVFFVTMLMLALFRETLYCYAGCYMMRTSLFFRSYPQGQIPVSREGQNLQMLLPPASYSKCGYVDQALMVYRIHQHSHAHHSRSLPELVTRAQGFYDLRMQLLDYCNCDRAVYSREAAAILENFKKNMLKQASYLYKAKKLQEKQL